MTFIRYREIISTLVVILTGTSTFQPLQATSQSSGTDGITGSIASSLKVSTCHVKQGIQPTDLIDMKSIVAGTIVETTAVQREAFVCKTPDGTPAIVDVHIYLGLKDSLLNQTRMDRDIDILSCAKFFNGTLLRCISTEPTEGTPVAAKCRSPYPPGLIVMDKVAGSGDSSGLIKTTDVYSDMSICTGAGGNPVIINIMTLTEFYSNWNSTTPGKKNVSTLMCTLEIIDLTPLGCNLL
jgi:hypothetical protein